ncbi:DUF2125 domain-containing protein [Roseivivax sp. CAU 1753]
MKKLILVVVAAALLWSGAWFWQARALRGEIDAWFAAKRADGWVAEAADISVHGFPNRLDARFEELVLEPRPGLRWEVPKLQVMQLVYDPEHLIIAALGGQRLEFNGEQITIDGDGLRASAVSEDGTLDRIAIEAARLDLIRNGRSNIYLRDLGGTLNRLPGQPETWRLALAAAPVGPDAPKAGDERISLDATLGLAGALSAAAQLQTIALDGLTYRSGGAGLSLSGDFEIDDKRRLSGPLTLDAEQWRTLLARAGQEGRLPQEVVPLLENVFNVVAGLSGSGDDLDLTLRIDKGRVSLGPLTIGRLPDM